MEVENKAQQLQRQEERIGELESELSVYSENHRMMSEQLRESEMKKHELDQQVSHDSTDHFIISMLGWVLVLYSRFVGRALGNYMIVICVGDLAFGFGQLRNCGKVCVATC